MITVLLADDEAVVREGLRRVLEAEPGIRVVAEVSQGGEIVSAVARVRPTVIVLDLAMPWVQRLDVLRHVSREFPDTRVLVLSTHAHEPYVTEALRHGAAGYVLKGCASAELVTAIRVVAAGSRYVAPELAGGVPSFSARNLASQDSFETLTGREREILRLVAEGHTSASISALLGIGPRTVETHRANMMRKLDLKTPAELVRFALTIGLLPPG